MNCEHSWAGIPGLSCQLPLDDDPDVGRVFHECHLVAGHVGRGADLHECACEATTSHQDYLGRRRQDREHYEQAVRRNAQLNLFLQVMEWKPGDYGWRDRLPTSEELRAHRGNWAVKGYGFSTCAAAIEAGGGYPDRWVDFSYAEIDGITSYRPVTHDLWPAPWPEVTP